MTVEEVRKEQARERARAMRYKKPLVKDLNYDGILTSLYDMKENCDCVDYWDRDAIEDAIGDDEDTDQFLTEFHMLDNDIDRAIDELTDWQSMSQEDYDLCLVAAGAGDAGGGYIGFDAYEEDYFSIDGL